MSAAAAGGALDPAALGLEALRWRDGALELLDQERLPGAEEWLRVGSVAAFEEAVLRLAVRGAPALGCAGAYALVVALQDAEGPEAWEARRREAAPRLAAVRPTAVNLRVGVERMDAVAAELAAGARPFADWAPALLEAARAFHAGHHGAGVGTEPLIERKSVVVLARSNAHCDALG